MTRREFVNRENKKLGQFLEVEHLVGWRREYKCHCGFRCYAPGEIWDHSGSCEQPKQRVNP